MRIVLIVLLAITAASSVAIGTLMIIHPSDIGMNISLKYLRETPFTSYTVPGLLIISFIGGSSAHALFHVAKGSPDFIKHSFFSGISLSLWIMMQMLLIPNAASVSILFLLIGILIILTSAQLRHMEVL